MEEQSHPCFMAAHLPPHSQSAEDEYIDIDLTSAALIRRRGAAVYSTPRLSVVDHFEFQMSSAHYRSQPLTSPADELFYRGQLLPLLSPPRLQLVEKLHDELACPGRSIIVTASATTSSRATTPFASCTVSPAASCYASGELRPEDISGEFSDPRPKKRWSKRLSFIKQFTLGSKLKASKAFLKSLFTKSGNPDEKCDDAVHLKKDEKKTSSPFGQVHLGEMRRHASTKSLPASSLLLSGYHSTSFSGVNLGGMNAVPPAPLKRSSSASSDMESSVQGAIAYCKKSQQMAAPSRKSASDAGFCLISACRVSPQGQKHDTASGLWRR